MRLYSMPSSGNSYKVRLLAAMVGLRLETVHCEFRSAALEAAKARGALPFGKVPALQVEGGVVLAESNAILCHLGEGTAFWPADAVNRAQMLGWMFWEQYNHEPVIAVRQALVTYPHRAADATPARLADLLERGHALLGVMEAALAGRDWLAGDAASLADICLYAYTHSAGPRGGFEMDRFPALQAWLDRVAALPGHVRIDD
ncbi:glutathione S-transferase family protein [Paracoccus gahaiensis]|uniref:Glutathione S-transferase family protein n=1 Tax=Paracoccus gahaiensis TaxID=1706839 RepID=A0A4U0R6R9_9RHOB|nr:glutathione S-transferase family protein [Paracoccus gahaiensis]TJZ90436.1 glutathione S-transferase family protein [Paracoccus gahaiensis]